MKKEKVIGIVLVIALILGLISYRQYLMRKAPEVHHYNQESILTKYTYFDGQTYYLINNSSLLKVDNEIIEKFSGPLEFDWINDGVYLLENARLKTRIREIDVEENYRINIPNYEDFIVNCGGKNVIFAWDKSGLAFFTGGGYYSSVGAMIGRDDLYYFDNLLIVAIDQSVEVYEMKDKSITNHLSYKNERDYSTTEFMLGVSHYDSDIYYVVRKGVYDFKKLYRNYNVILNRNHKDILYRYNIDSEKNVELFSTNNVIIRYTDKEVYMLTRNNELIHYDMESEETTSLGKIKRSCNEVHNCKDLIVFYSGNQLLKIYDTSKNEFIEMPKE